ncbi:MAG: hypothetical protein ACXWPP_22040 [Ktedonobacteraceae bacterium]
MASQTNQEIVAYYYRVITKIHVAKVLLPGIPITFQDFFFPTLEIGRDMIQPYITTSILHI